MTPGPGPDAAPAGWHGFGEYLRRALRAAADQVEPRPDGLAPIRARIGDRGGRAVAPGVRYQPVLDPRRLGPALPP